jgi:hypothetical protein
MGWSFATGKLHDPTLPPLREYLYGGDVVLKWRPPNNAKHFRSLQWTTEYFARTLASGGPTEGAIYTEPVVQVARRWLVGARLDVTGLPEGPYVPRRYGAATSLTFRPSEFAFVRAYFQNIFVPGADSAQVLFLQVQFAMGAHGAHPY